MSQLEPFGGRFVGISRSGILVVSLEIVPEGYCGQSRLIVSRMKRQDDGAASSTVGLESSGLNQRNLTGSGQEKDVTHKNRWLTLIFQSGSSS